MDVWIGTKGRRRFGAQTGVTPSRRRGDGSERAWTTESRAGQISTKFVKAAVPRCRNAHSTLTSDCLVAARVAAVKPVRDVPILSTSGAHATGRRPFGIAHPQVSIIVTSEVPSNAGSVTPDACVIPSGSLASGMAL